MRLPFILLSCCFCFRELLVAIWANRRIDRGSRRDIDVHVKSVSSICISPRSHCLRIEKQRTHSWIVHTTCNQVVLRSRRNEVHAFRANGTRAPKRTRARDRCLKIASVQLFDFCSRFSKYRKKTRDTKTTDCGHKEKECESL